jgi:hypothetical protein
MQITTLEIPLELKLSTLFRMSPGDYCPGDECDGTIEKVVLTWAEGSLDGEGHCAKCGEAWTLIEVPSMGDAMDEPEPMDKPGPPPGNRDEELQAAYYSDKAKLAADLRVELAKLKEEGGEELEIQILQRKLEMAEYVGD